MKSLVPNAPVLLNKTPVMKETLVDHKGVIAIGTCSFRFDYHGGALPGTPLKEENKTATPKQVQQSTRAVQFRMNVIYSTLCFNLFF